MTPTEYRLDEHDRRLIDVERACGAVAVLEERVKTLSDEVKAMKRALWAFVFSILGGVILFLLSVAANWVGGGS